LHGEGPLADLLSAQVMPDFNEPPSIGQPHFQNPRPPRRAAAPPRITWAWVRSGEASFPRIDHELFSGNHSRTQKTVGSFVDFEWVLHAAEPTER
jgi:hypothetical protein